MIVACIVDGGEECRTENIHPKPEQVTASCKLCFDRGPVHSRPRQAVFQMVTWYALDCFLSSIITLGRYEYLYTPRNALAHPVFSFLLYSWKNIKSFSMIL